MAASQSYFETSGAPGGEYRVCGAHLAHAGRMKSVTGATEVAGQIDRSRPASTPESFSVSDGAVGFWVTVTPAKGEIREPQEAFCGAYAARKCAAVQEEKAGGEGQN